METIREQTDFIKILKKLVDEKKTQEEDASKKLEEFDFYIMFTELEKILKEYQNAHSKKSCESELELSELTLTT